MKIIKYFFQAIIIYTFFIIIKIIGISLSRKIFSSIFKIMGSALRSEVITNDNIEQALNVDFEKRKSSSRN